MASSPIDYAALAAKYGAVPAAPQGSTDYAALARKYGAVGSTPAPAAPPRPIPPPAPAPAGNMIRPYTPSIMDRLKGTVANSAIGNALEQELPHVADALGLHPTETVNSPTYQADKGQILAPQYLMPSNPTSATGNVAKGVLRGVGQLTSGKNLAIGTGIAATGGLAAPALEAGGAIGTLARVGAQGARLGAAAVGARGVYSDGKQVVQKMQSGDTNGALQDLGAALPNAALTLPALGEPLQMAGEAAQRGGVNLINETIGARSKDFARGASPGEGYFQAGLGPSASMRSIADKVGSALQATGQGIGDVTNGAEQAGTLIPLETGRAAIQDAVTRARQSLAGPGGTGNTNAVDDYANTFKPMMDAAEARGGFLPSEYAQAKRNVAQNTTWGDPTQVGMKALRQQTVGAMGGELTNAIPGLSDLNSQYQNLYKLQGRAADRADTGSMPLTSLVNKAGLGLLGAASGAITHNPYLSLATGAASAALDSVPLRTTAASSLYYGGKALSTAGSKLSTVVPLLGSAGADGGTDYVDPQSNADQSEYRDQNHAAPQSAPYSLRNLTPEIINPGAQSRSKFGVGADGRGGMLIRPLGMLAAPTIPAPQATPYSFNTKPTIAVPGTSGDRLVPSVGSIGSLVPKSLLAPLTSSGTPEEKAAALRLAQLGSLGLVVPPRSVSLIPVPKLGGR